MSKIKILPESWANQIAAGEVVERPASVVKEFIENSIDAGAKNIAVEVEGNGTRMIRVIDDGCGMDGDDALLCLERHATSKLAGPEELARISTLGFRGEAVPSIASVSRLVIITRQVQNFLGTKVEVRFGRVRKMHETGCAKGTVIEVRDLFGNVPARRKFLKSRRTELFHIEEVVKNYALSCAETGFVYAAGGREVWRFPPGQSMEQRFRHLLRRRDGILIPLDSGPPEKNEAGRLKGFLLPPDEVGGAAARLRLFVNGRAVSDRMVSHAVVEGMRNFLLKGRSPAGALFLEVAPGLVDVNVHPAKREIRFQRANDVHRLVADTVRLSLENFQHQVRTKIFAVPVTPHDALPASTPSLPPENKTEPQPLDFASPASPLQQCAEPAAERIFSSPAADNLPEQPASSDPAPEGREEISPFVRLRYMGQIFSSYLLCQSDSGLVVIDQHAAHERLLFEKLKKQYQAGNLAGQALLFPEVVECTSEELGIIRKYRREIAALGLEVQEFSGNSCAIKGLPAIVAHLAPAEILAGVLAGFGGQAADSSRLPGRIEDILATMACKAAIKANHELHREEAQSLLRQMLEADVFSHCPHGRPVAKLFSPNEVKKWFLRT